MKPEDIAKITAKWWVDNEQISALEHGIEQLNNYRRYVENTNE